PRPRRPRAARPGRCGGPPAGHRPLDLAPHRRRHRRALPGAAGRDARHPVPASRWRRHGSPLRHDPGLRPPGAALMLTVDYDRLGVRAGDRLLDLGCGFGRHAYEALRRGADVVACDMALPELTEVCKLMQAMAEAGEIPPTVTAGCV